LESEDDPAGFLMTVTERIGVLDRIFDAANLRLDWRAMDLRVGFLVLLIFVALGC